MQNSVLDKVFLVVVHDRRWAVVENASIAHVWVAIGIAGSADVVHFYPVAEACFAVALEEVVSAVAAAGDFFVLAGVVADVAVLAVDVADLVVFDSEVMVGLACWGMVLANWTLL